MEHEAFLPADLEGLETWLKNFSDVKTESGALFGFDSDSIAATNADYAAVKYLNDDINSGRSELSGKVAYRDLVIYNKAGEPVTTFHPFTNPIAPYVPVPAGIVQRIYADNKTIKGNLTVYNDDWGKLFGLIGAEKIFTPSTFVPDISYDVFTDHIEIYFVKHGSQGIFLYIKKPGDPTFIKIDKFTKTGIIIPYTLAVAGQPETWKVYAMGMFDDAMIGHPCAVISVTVTGPPV